jgi:hypothetical protein
MGYRLTLLRLFLYVIGLCVSFSCSILEIPPTPTSTRKPTSLPTSTPDVIAFEGRLIAEIEIDGIPGIYEVRINPINKELISTQILLASADHVYLSPDNKFLLYTPYIFDLQTGAKKLISLQNRAASNFKWSPDSSKISFVITIPVGGDVGGLYIYDVFTDKFHLVYEILSGEYYDGAGTRNEELINRGWLGNEMLVFCHLDEMPNFITVDPEFPPELEANVTTVLWISNSYESKYISEGYWVYPLSSISPDGNFIFYYFANQMLVPVGKLISSLPEYTVNNSGSVGPLGEEDLDFEPIPQRPIRSPIWFFPGSSDEVFFVANSRIYYYDLQAKTLVEGPTLDSTYTWGGSIEERNQISGMVRSSRPWGGVWLGNPDDRVIVVVEEDSESTYITFVDLKTNIAQRLMPVESARILAWLPSP